MHLVQRLFVFMPVTMWMLRDMFVIWVSQGFSNLNPSQIYSNTISFTCSCFSLSYIFELVIENKARVSCTPMWDIFRLPCRRTHGALYLDDKEEMIRRMKTIRYLFRLTCASWIPCLITSGSDLGWDLGFELRFSVGMVLGSPVGYTIGYSFNMFIGLKLDNSFDALEGYWVGVSLGPFYGLIIDSG